MARRVPGWLLLLGLERHRPDVYGAEALVFPNREGGAMDYQNFRSRIFSRLVRKAFKGERHITAHCLRHTFASLHMRAAPT